MGRSDAATRNACSWTCRTSADVPWKGSTGRATLRDRAAARFFERRVSRSRSTMMRSVGSCTGLVMNWSAPSFTVSTASSMVP